MISAGAFPFGLANHPVIRLNCGSPSITFADSTFPAQWGSHLEEAVLVFLLPQPEPSRDPFAGGESDLGIPKVPMGQAGVAYDDQVSC